MYIYRIFYKQKLRNMELSGNNLKLTDEELNAISSLAKAKDLSINHMFVQIFNTGFEGERTGSSVQNFNNPKSDSFSIKKNYIYTFFGILVVIFGFKFLKPSAKKGNPFGI